MLGNYKVKNAGLQPLHAKARAAGARDRPRDVRARRPRAERARRSPRQRGYGRSGRGPDRPPAIAAAPALAVAAIRAEHVGMARRAQLRDEDLIGRHARRLAADRAPTASRRRTSDPARVGRERRHRRIALSGCGSSRTSARARRRKPAPRTRRARRAHFVAARADRRPDADDADRAARLPNSRASALDRRDAARRAARPRQPACAAATAPVRAIGDQQRHAVGGLNRQRRAPDRR